MTDLTQAEQDFFRTGELPPELETQHAAAQPDATPPIDPATIVPSAPVAAPAPAALDPVAEMRAMLAAEQARRSDVEDKFTKLSEQLQSVLKQQTVVQAPDEVTDPLGAMMHQLKAVTDNVSTLKQQLEQEQLKSDAQKQYEQFSHSINNIKTEYMKGVPDFQSAYAHLRAVRTEDLRNYGVPESQIQQILLQDEVAVAQAALSKGQNPADIIYKTAQRHGYSAKAAPVPVTPADKIATLIEGQASAKAPTSSSSSEPMTLETLRNASDSDLSKLAQDDKAWARIVGGGSHDIFG